MNSRVRCTRLRAWTAVLALSIALPGVAGAQALMDQKSVVELRQRYLADLDTVHVKIMSLAEAIPESSYGWRPAAGVRSISEALMHVASEWYFYAPLLIGGNAPVNFGAPREALPKLEKITAKKEVLSELAKAWTHCKQQVEASDVTKLMSPYKVFGRDVPFAEAAFIMSGDLHEHLGQLIAYARSVNVTPPWSKK